MNSEIRNRSFTKLSREGDRLTPQASFRGQKPISDWTFAQDWNFDAAESDSSPMLDQTIPALIPLSIGGKLSVCAATLTYKNGRLYAEPATFDPVFAPFDSVAVEEQFFELVQGVWGSKPVYHYRRLIVLQR